MRTLPVAVMVLLALVSVTSPADAVEVVGVTTITACNDPIFMTEQCNAIVGPGTRPCRSEDLLRATSVSGVPTPPVGGPIVAYTFLRTPVAAVAETASRPTIVDALGSSYQNSTTFQACGFYVRNPNGTAQYSISTSVPSGTNSVGGALCCRD